MGRKPCSRCVRESVAGESSARFGQAPTRGRGVRPLSGHAVGTRWKENETSRMDHLEGLASDWSAWLRGEGLKESKLGDFLPGVHPKTLHNALRIYHAGDWIKQLDRRHYEVRGVRRQRPILVYFSQGLWKCKECTGRTSENLCSHVLAVMLQAESDLLPEPGEVEYKGDGGRDFRAIKNAEAAMPALFPQYVSRLVEAVPEDAYAGAGRPRSQRRDLVFSALVWAASGISMEQARGLLRTAAYLRYCPEPASAAAICNFLQEPHTQGLLEELLLVSAAPMAPWEDTVLVDGTGLASTRFFSYSDARHGSPERPRKHRWVQAIPLMAKDSNVVPALAVTDPHASETPYLIPLVERARAVFNVKRVCADKAYVKKVHYLYGEQLGIDVQIPVKSNANPSASTPGRANKAYRRKMHEFQVDPVGHRRKYLQRNGAESLMHAVKRHSGEQLRCRNEVAQCNEVRLKFIVHNVRQLILQRFVRRVEPDFRAEAFRVRQREWRPMDSMLEQFSGKSAEQAVAALA